MKNLFRQLITAVLLFLCVLGNAQDGSVDLTFNPNDTGYGNGADNSIESLAVQQDGKIIIGGTFTHYKGVSRNGIARLNADETLDESFNPGSGANYRVNKILLLQNGKILAGGTFTQYNGVTKNGLVRINADGTVDQTFDVGTGFNGSVQTIDVQDDGKILVGGAFTRYNNNTANKIIRLNVDGTVDTSLNTTGANGTIWEILVQPDGKILVGGVFSTFNGFSVNNILRINSDGSWDTTFSTGTGANSLVTALAMDNDGKIYVGGWFFEFNNIAEGGLVRLNNNGSKDLTFIPPLSSATIFDIALQQNGKVVIAGGIEEPGLPANIGVLNSDGSVDTGFVCTGADFASTSVAIAPGGRIILGGRYILFNDIETDFIASVNPDGSLETFSDNGVTTGADSTIYHSVISNGKILICGNFKHYDGVERQRIARLNENGSLDLTFDPGDGPNDIVTKMVLQPDGKIVIIGEFTTYAGQPVQTIARINIDGTLDTTFNFSSPLTLSSWFGNIAIDHDGKILVSADLRGDDFNDVTYILRLNTDGSVDGNFRTDNVKNLVQEILLQENGKILLGISADVMDLTKPTVLRLNSDGSVDNSFQTIPGSFINSVSDLQLQADNKIVCTGSIPNTNFSGYRIFRLNTDGTIDSSFSAAGMDNKQILLVKPQQDGKIIIYGDIYSQNLTSMFNIIRLNNDGSVDSTFDAGTGPGHRVNSLVLQNDGKIIISGYFFSYNGTGRNRIARLYNSGALYTETPEIETAKVIAYKNNEGVTVTSLHQPLTSVQVYDVTGKLLANETVTGKMEIMLPVANAKKSILLIKATLANGNTINKKIY